MPPRPIVLDDRLLIHELLVGLPTRGAPLHTTTYWYYRACRAAVLGAGGHLSGPFQGLPDAEQRLAVLAMLALPNHISLPESRALVPAMVDVAGRHPRLNLLNLEVAAYAGLVGATVWLSPEAAAGVLPDVLDADGIRWRTVALE